MSETLVDKLKESQMPSGPALSGLKYKSKKMKGHNLMVFNHWIEDWVRNAVSNYPTIRDGMGVGFLKDSSRGVPATIVGIGPSLDKSLPKMRGLERKSIVIATDAALRPLLANNIKPHIVVNFDARAEQCSMWNTINHLSHDITLVANSCTSPHTLAAWKGPVLYYNMTQSDDEFASNILPIIYPGIGTLPSLGTVGNGAVYLANYMGCEPIVTYGFDYCYSEGKYRCDDYEYNDSPAFDQTIGFRKTENKLLYDNAKRMEKTFEDHIPDKFEVPGASYLIDDALLRYRNKLIEMIGRFDFNIIDCSGKVLKHFFKSMSPEDANMDIFRREIMPGESVANHLPALIPNTERIIVNGLLLHNTLDEYPPDSHRCQRTKENNKC